MINASQVAEPTLTDLESIDRCLDGEADQFGFLVNRYQRAVLAYLRGRMRQRDRVDEAAQETFVRAYLNLASLRKRDSFFSWLLGIARRVAREVDRQEQREAGMLSRYALQTRSDPQPVHALAEDHQLEAAVDSLPEKLKEVVLLRFYSGQSCLEIANLLGIPLGTVTKRLSRAYRLIYRRISK